MAKGCTQHSGLDFFEISSPVVGFDHLPIILAVSASKGWNVRATDFKQAYLNEPLVEDIWLELPGRKVVQACKAVYVHRQSAMEWRKELRKSIVGAGWESSAHDECLNYRCGSNGAITVLTTYADSRAGDDEDCEYGASGVSHQSNPLPTYTSHLNCT